jgi:hypothetical protein
VTPIDHVHDVPVEALLWSLGAAAKRSECGNGGFKVAEVEGVLAGAGRARSARCHWGVSGMVGDRVREELV